MKQQEKGFWDYIDAILIINLAKRTDRWNEIQAQLENIGVAHKAVKVEAIEGIRIRNYNAGPFFKKKTPPDVARMRAGSAGCCLSHRTAIEYAKQKGYKRILLMEDDASFLDPLTGDVGGDLGEFIESCPNLGMFYLGFYKKRCPYVKIKELKSSLGSHEIWEIQGPLMLHATVVDASLFDLLLAGLPTEKNIWPWISYWGSIDAWIQNELGRRPDVHIYGTKPSLVVQKANYSDICGRVLTVEESEGTHRQMKATELSQNDFARAKSKPFWLILTQKIKRSGRLLKSYIFGFRKT